MFFATHGTKRVKFTGGEPLIYSDLKRLIEMATSLGIESTIITNGTIHSEELSRQFVDHKVKLKVSLHGFRERHDEIQNQRTYDTILENVRRFVSTGLHVSVHTLLDRLHPLDLADWTEFLIGEGIQKVSFMSFVPRGRGRFLDDLWSVSTIDLDRVGSSIATLAEHFREKIVVRHLDFARRPYLVFETDGRLVWETREEHADRVLDLRPAQ